MGYADYYGYSSGVWTATSTSANTITMYYGDACGDAPTPPESAALDRAFDGENVRWLRDRVDSMRATLH